MYKRYGYSPFMWGFGVSMGSFAAHILQGILIGLFILIGYGVVCLFEALTK